MDIKDSYLHGTVGVVKSISVSADKLTYNLADINNTAKTITLPLATTIANGLMSKDDKIAINSLGNYVTLNTDQEINGIKTFTKQLKFTAAKGTAPFLVTSDTKVDNLNADLLDGVTNGDLTSKYINTSILNHQHTLDTINDGFYSYKDGDNPTNVLGNNGALIQISGRTWDRFLLLFPGNNATAIKFRNSTYESNSTWEWNAWKTVAFTDSNITGNSASADKLKTKRKLWGLYFDGTADVSGDMTGVGNLSMAGDLTIISGDTDKYITFDTVVSEHTHSWRIGYIGSGVADANYFVLQSTQNTPNTWTSALTITNGTLESTFAASVTAPTFKGNLDGAYVNKLTNYEIATTIGSVATTDSLNTALGKLEYKLNIAYDLVTKANDSDGTIENLKEILDVLAGIKDTETIKGLLGKYLPLIGGTMTGAITLTSGGSSALDKTALSFIRSSDKSEQARIGTNTANDLGMYANGTIYIRPNVAFDSSSSNGLVISSSSFTYNGIAVSLNGHNHLYIATTPFLNKVEGTVATYKTNIHSALSGMTGIGKHITVADSIIRNWSNNSASYSPGSAASIISINGAYNGTTHGQFLVSSWVYGLGLLKYANGFQNIEWFSTASHNHDSSYIRYAKVTKATADNTNALPYLYNIENEELVSGYYGYWYVFNMGRYSGGNYGTQLAMPYQGSLADTELFIRRAKSGVWRDWRRVLHSGNYTNYVNTTNFPGLDKVGTVTSVTVTGSNGLSGSGTITASGTITLSNAGVRSTTINGNYLRVNTNGTNADLTIPYAITANLLRNTSTSDSNTAASGLNLKWYSQVNQSSGYAGANYGFPASNNANGILWLGTHPGPYGWLMGFSSNGRIYARYIRNNNFPTDANGGSWKEIAFTDSIITGNAASATTIKIETASGNVNYPVLFTSSTSSSNTASVYIDADSKITFNPSTNTLACTNFEGTVTNVLGVAETDDVSRHIWFSHSTTETQRTWDDNFMYNPKTNTLTVGSITGSARKLTTTTIISSKEFSLSNASWTDTGYTFANLDTGTYAVQVTFETTLVASGIMSVYKDLADTAGDEIPLHVYGTAGWRPYLRTYANKLLISSNDTISTARTVTIKIALIL